MGSVEGGVGGVEGVGGALSMDLASVIPPAPRAPALNPSPCPCQFPLRCSQARGS